VPFATPAGAQWRMVEEFETSHAIVPLLPDDYFTAVVEEFLATGRGVQGRVGEAASTMVEAAAITAFAVDWLERRCN
jgi:aminoglycoside 3-N-acetyltransferase